MSFYHYGVGLFSKLKMVVVNLFKQHCCVPLAMFLQLEKFVILSNMEHIEDVVGVWSHSLFERHRETRLFKF